MFKEQFSEVEDACALAQAIVDTVREPLVVLDKDLRVVAASRSFCVKFRTNPNDTQESLFMNWAAARSGPKGTTTSVTHATFAGREAQNPPVAA